MKKRVLVISSCVVVAGLAAIGIGSRMKEPSQAASAPLADINVMAQVPEQGSLEQMSSFIGTIQPDESVQVYPKVSGTVLRTHFEVGDQVRKGDLLYEIDPTDIQLQYDATAAQLESQKLQLDQTFGAGWDSNTAAMEMAVTNAQLAMQKARNALDDYNDQQNDGDEDVILLLKREADRKYDAYKAAEEKVNNFPKDDPNYKEDPEYKKLSEELIAAEEAYLAARSTYNEQEADDDAEHRSLRLQYQQAQEAYENALYNLEIFKNGTTEETQQTVDAGLRSIEASLRAQEQQLGYTKVYSPIDGVIEQKNVTDNNPSNVSSPAYVVSNKSLMTVRFAVSESVVSNMEVGDPVVVENGSQTINGTITEISTAVDPQSGLFSVKATVDSSQATLHTGSSVKITAATQKSNDSLLIPIDCVYYDQETPYVYVYKDGKAVKTEIETGVTGTDEIAVVSGLSPEDQVITTWHPRLLDGADVVLASQSSAENSSETSQTAEPEEASSSQSSSDSDSTSDPSSSQEEDTTSQQA